MNQSSEMLRSVRSGPLAGSLTILVRALRQALGRASATEQRAGLHGSVVRDVSICQLSIALVLAATASSCAVQEGTREVSAPLNGVGVEAEAQATTGSHSTSADAAVALTKKIVPEGAAIRVARTATEGGAHAPNTEALEAKPNRPSPPPRGRELPAQLAEVNASRLLKIFAKPLNLGFAYPKFARAMDRAKDEFEKRAIEQELRPKFEAQAAAERKLARAGVFTLTMSFGGGFGKDGRAREYDFARQAWPVEFGEKSLKGDGAIWAEVYSTKPTDSWSRDEVRFADSAWLHWRPMELAKAKSYKRSIKKSEREYLQLAVTPTGHVDELRMSSAPYRNGAPTGCIVETATGKRHYYVCPRRERLDVEVLGRRFCRARRAAPGAIPSPKKMKCGEWVHVSR